MKKEAMISYPDYFLFSLFIIFFVSVVFSFRAISSLSIGVILTTGIIRNHKNFGHFFSHKALAFFLLGCGLLFLLQCFALFYTHNIAEGFSLLQRSSGIVFVPFAFFSNQNFIKEKFQKISFYFAVVLCVGSLYCLATAFAGYFSDAPVSVFFYHDLLKPLSQHAIQFSIMVFIALVFLIGELKHSENYFPNILCRLMIAFLSLVLILLSSKLIISFYILHLLYFFFSKKIRNVKTIVLIPAFIISVVIIVITPNPIGNRFRGMFTGNSLLFAQDSFSPHTYFNGLQFRLLEWKLTYEILNERLAWLSGLTPGDAQSFLDRKYIQKNMYTGVPSTQNHGYLGYHTHNQFLQILLENGWPGLILFFFTCFWLLKLAIECRRSILKWFVFLLLIYCFTDAPFKTQYGIVIFTCFPIFLYMGSPSPAISPSFNKLSREFNQNYSAEQPN